MGMVRRVVLPQKRKQNIKGPGDKGIRPAQLTGNGYWAGAGEVRGSQAIGHRASSGW